MVKSAQASIAKWRGWLILIKSDGEERGMKSNLEARTNKGQIDNLITTSNCTLRWCNGYAKDILKVDLGKYLVCLFRVSNTYIVI